MATMELVGWAVLLAGMLSGEAGYAADSAEDDRTVMRAPVRGGHLTEEQARALEATVEASPTDLEARAQLLGYYFLRASRSEDARRARQDHILWIITLEDRAKAKSLARQAQGAEPDNPVWPRHLAHLESLGLSRIADASERRETAGRALEYLEQAKPSTNEPGSVHLLADLLCSRLWRRGGKARELDEWAAVVRGGGMPRFGANLDY